MGRKLNESTDYKWQQHVRRHSGSIILSSHRHMASNNRRKTFGYIICNKEFSTK